MCCITTTLELQDKTNSHMLWSITTVLKTTHSRFRWGMHTLGEDSLIQLLRLRLVYWLANHGQVWYERRGKPDYGPGMEEGGKPE